MRIEPRHRSSKNLCLKSIITIHTSHPLSTLLSLPRLSIHPIHKTEKKRKQHLLLSQLTLDESPKNIESSYILCFLERILHARIPSTVNCNFTTTFLAILALQLPYSLPTILPITSHNSTSGYYIHIAFCTIEKSLDAREYNAHNYLW